MGKGEALKTGLRVTIDADGQHDPDEIPKLTKYILFKEFDMVIGSRYKWK